MKTIVCAGKYAENPYFFEKLGIYVYSMEELCFFLKENPFLLGNEIMNPKMIDFIEKECRIAELAKTLKTVINKGGTLSTFVTLILEYISLYDQETIEEVENSLKMGAGLSEFEKKKIRIDYAVSKKRFIEALKEYDELLIYLRLTQTMGGEILELLAKILHNKGIVLVYLLYYKEAADCFWEAYEISSDEDTLLSYLAVKRMELKENEYIDLVASIEESYATSLELEKRIKGLEEEWLKTMECMKIEEMKSWRRFGEKGKYYEESVRVINTLKNTYRDVFES